MPSFAITTPKYGVGEHVPKTLLSQAFISRDSRNVREYQGAYRALRGRLPAIYDADQQQIAAPEMVYAVTAVNQGTKTLTVDGNHADDITGAAVGNKVRINGSTGNDALYTLVSATDVDTDTEIVVSEALPDATVDGNLFVGETPILTYHLYVKDPLGAEYLLIATACHILLWNETTRTLTVKFTCANPTEVTAWSIVTHLDCVYATNDSDKVVTWDASTSVGNVFEALGSASGVQISDTPSYLTKAKCLYSSQGFLWLGGTTEDGTSHPRRVRYSDANADTFNTSGAGDTGSKDVDDTCGFVTGFADLQQYVVIATEKRMVRAWLTATDTPWYFSTERVRVGCVAPRTLVNDREGRLYWLASDLTIRELETGQAVTRPHAAQTLRKLNIAAVVGSCAMYYEATERLLFAVPTAESDINDLLIEFDPYTQSVIYHSVPVAAFGSYARQYIYTWDTLPYNTYDEWGAAWLIWDANANAVGFPLVLVGDASGRSYEFDQSDNDAGSSIARELVFEAGLVEPQKYLPLFKRVSDGLDFFFQRHAETSITVYAKRDGESHWQTVGTSPLAGDGREKEQVAIHLDCDLRAKHFTFKIVADGYFEFVGLYVNNVELDGLR